SAARRWRPLPPCIEAAGGDAQHPAHRRGSITGLIRTHELERRDGTEPVSVANQAAAFDKISRSSRRTRFSRLSRVSSWRSSVVSPSLRRPSSRSACATQLRIDCEVSGTLAPVPRRCVPPAPAPPSAADTPARTVCACFPSWLLLYLPNSLTVHETGSTPVKRRRGGFVFGLPHHASCRLRSFAEPRDDRSLPVAVGLFLRFQDPRDDPVTRANWVRLVVFVSAKAFPTYRLRRPR